jgi:ankyrin repeat protein
LHAAIKEIKRGLAFHPAIPCLIEKSDDDSFRDGDADGNTPLHLAVKHEHFADADNQLPLVKMLVEKYPGALDKTNKVEKKLAPFIYLQECRREFKASKSTDSKHVEQKAAEPKKPPPNTAGPPTLAPPTPGGLANKAVVRVNSIGPEPNTSATREPERPKHRKKKKSKKVELSDDQVVLIFREIEKFLKKYILQKFPHSEAQKILYGPLSGTF